MTTRTVLPSPEMRGKLRGIVVHERRRTFLVRLGQRRPGLDAEQPRTHGALLGRCAFRMHDAGPRRHQVELPRLDGNGAAEAVAVHDLAVEQIGHGGEPDVRMRAHVDAGADEELRRTHLIEKDKRPDHLPPRRRQGAAHGEAAEVASARHDHLLDGLAGAHIAGLRIVGRGPAHLLRSHRAVTRGHPYCIRRAPLQSRRYQGE